MRRGWLGRTQAELQSRRLSHHGVRAFRHREPESHGAGQQMAYRNGVSGRLGVIEWRIDPTKHATTGQFGNEPLDGIIDVEPATLGESQRRGGRNWLRQGADSNEGIGRYRLIGVTRG